MGDVRNSNVTAAAAGGAAWNAGSEPSPKKIKAGCVVDDLADFRGANSEVLGDIVEFAGLIQSLRDIKTSVETKGNPTLSCFWTELERDIEERQQRIAKCISDGTAAFQIKMKAYQFVKEMQVLVAEFKVILE